VRRLAWQKTVFMPNNPRPFVKGLGSGELLEIKTTGWILISQNVITQFPLSERRSLQSRTFEFRNTCTFVFDRGSCATVSICIILVSLDYICY
jgi:hypothetical protein